MNISTLFQPVGDVALSGIPPRRFPPFLAVWGGQTEREAAFLNVKLHAARFRVCVGLAAHIGVLLGIGGKPLLQVGVVGTDNPGMSDTQLRQLITAHIDEDEFCRYVIQRDINGIALALRETHKDDFFSVPEDNPLKEMLETAGEIVSQDSDTEQAYLAFICKRLKLNFRKLSVEERKWLKKIAEKSDLLKNPKPQRGRR